MEQIELIRHAVQTLDTLAVPYALVGSWGSGIYGEPRFTRDIDIVLDVILGKLWYFAEGGGDRHLRDIAGILRVTGDGVSRAEVERWATKLGYLEIWQQIVAKVDGPDSPPGPGTP
jgi:hypothetical protein